MPSYRSSVSDAEAYTVKCPRCKSMPRFTCTYLPELMSSGKWHPKSGKPTKKPHTERRDAYRKRQLHENRRLREAAEVMASRERYVTWRMSIQRSIREGALRDQAELVAWLRHHAHILTELTNDVDPAKFNLDRARSSDEEGDT